MNIHLIDSLLYCTLFIASYINKEQCSKLSIKCAFVSSLCIYENMHGTNVKISIAVLL